MLKKAMGGDRKDLERGGRPLLEKTGENSRDKNSRRRVGKDEDTEAAILEEE